MSAVYEPPLRASMKPEVLNLAMAARVVKALAVPLERPNTPSSPLPEAPGVASNCAVKLLFCWAKAAFHHEPLLVRQAALPVLPAPS